MATILVADDDAQIRKLLRTILESNGYQVVEASNGKEAIAAYQTHKPDLVITDIVMPETEGIETIMTLKKKDPAVRIIAISGGGAGAPSSYLQVAQRLGAVQTMEKPLDIKKMVRLVAAFVDAKA